MKILKLYPSQQLAQYIDYYWWIEMDSLEENLKTEKILADSSLEVILHFGNPISRVSSDADIQVEPIALLIGQTIQPYTIISSPQTAMFGIRFLPHIGKYFFDIPLKEMNDTYINLVDLWGNDINTLRNQIANLFSVTEKIEAIERYLLKKLNPKVKISLFIEDVLKEMRNKNGIVCIRNLSSDRDITTRHLEKIFINDIGVSPKLMARIFQFQYTLKLIRNTPDTLTHLGLEAGYFDQSHFISNFKIFTETTPSQFIKEHFPIQKLLGNLN
jgi:AraC-like DNA-binding protein